MYKYRTLHYSMSYYIAPRLLNTLSVHITKNFLGISDIQIPLILGLHGPKGEGKSFQCELIFKEMGLLKMNFTLECLLARY